MKRVTLTFDNGPHLEGTPLLLDALAARGIKATFFLVAERLQQPGLRAIALRARQEGHRLANHTMTHGIPLGWRTEPGVVQREIGDAQRLLDGLTSEWLFRPNGDKGKLGEHMLSEEAVQYLVDHRYTAVSWNCVPEDWVPPADAWLGRAERTMRDQDWTVLVLHDHCAGTMLHVAGFLDGLMAQGYQFSQEFPPDCVLIDQGRPTLALAGRFTKSVPA